MKPYVQNVPVTIFRKDTGEPVSLLHLVDAKEAVANGSHQWSTTLFEIGTDKPVAMPEGPGSLDTAEALVARGTHRWSEEPVFICPKVGGKPVQVAFPEGLMMVRANTHVWQRPEQV